jgi:2-O-methyltransferase
LILDRDGIEQVLHIADNDGASSSVLDLRLHRDVWPEVSYVDAMRMRSSTLPTALSVAGVDLSKYDALILDTQGSELMILEGVKPILDRFQYIQVEAADFESYRGGALVSEIAHFMQAHGFALKQKQLFARHQDGGGYYELLFRRRQR